MRWGLIRSDCGELCITDEIGNTCCGPQREREREHRERGNSGAVGEENGGNVRWSGEVLKWGDIERKNGFNE